MILRYEYRNEKLALGLITQDQSKTKTINFYVESNLFGLVIVGYNLYLTKVVVRKFL